MNDLPPAADEKSNAVRKVIRTSSSAAAVVILQPVPVVDVVLITPIQHRMVQAIGRIHGYPESTKARQYIFKTLRGRLVRMNAAIAGAKSVGLLPFVPFIGDLIGMSVAYALTSAIGELSDLYFGSACTMSDFHMTRCFDANYKRQYERAYEQKRNELKAMWLSPAIRRQVVELKRACREGRLSDDETRQRIEALLAPRPR
jgi:uncharacterized protein (DUF697 family)